MKRSFLLLVFVFALLVSFNFNNVNFVSYAQGNDVEIKVEAKSALLVDGASGEVIFEKNAHDKLPVASMTKLATLSIVFDAINKGIIKLSDSVVVSQNAASIKGSSAFLDAGSSYKLNDLVKSIIIASANDSCVAVAEFVSGSEELFVKRMNKFAADLNLKDTNFENCTGLPAKNHYSSAYDMLQIYKTVYDNEIYKAFAKIWMDDFVHPSGRRTELVNTNRLIKTYDGIEGGKTGYTDAAKFCLTASASRGGMRLLGVVIGVDDSKTRFAEMSKLFDYGFANFKNEELINSKVPVTILNIKNAKNIVEVYPEHDIVKFLSKNDTTKFSIDYQLYDIKAPQKAGNTVGKMFVFDENNMVVDEVELIINNDVSAVDFRYSINKIFSIW